MTISFRVKIITLITTMLLLSFACYLYLGTSLIIQDKSSYIYDSNLSTLRTVSELVTTQISKLESVSQILEGAAESGHLPQSFYEEFGKKNKNQLPESGLLIFKAKSKTEFEQILSFPTDNPFLRKTFQSQNWLPTHFEKSVLLMGTPMRGDVPIAIRGKNSADEPIVVFSTLHFTLEPLLAYLGKMQIEILNTDGERINSTQNFLDFANFPELAPFEKSVLHGAFPLGTEEVTIGHQEFLASYQKISGTSLTVIGFVDKKEAFVAARTLIRQSILLALGIIAIAMLASLYFAKSVTSKLHLLWMATQKIGEGNLEARVPLSAKNKIGGSDEIRDLSSSFNAMADRIQNLIKETEEKARMKSELETAHTVQSLFLPAQSYLSDHLELSGKSIPATECAGDWWQYKKIGPYLIVAIGDVTGHGVSSALVTAAAHGTFSVSMKDFEKQYEETKCEPSLEQLAKQLNTAVLAAGGESVSMTAILSIIDTSSNMLSLINASHPSLYVHRQGMSPVPEKCFHVINKGKMDALGMNSNPDPKPIQFQLEPGDLIIWYTDGLIECENEEGNTIRRATLLKILSEIDSFESLSKGRGRAERVCSDLVKKFSSFLGANMNTPNDDTTIVIGVVPFTS